MRCSYDRFQPSQTNLPPTAGPLFAAKSPPVWPRNAQNTKSPAGFPNRALALCERRESNLTGVTPQEPESCASASSATFAP